MKTLDEVAMSRNYKIETDWLRVDKVWWDQTNVDEQRLILVAESEMDPNMKAALDDFYKLPVFKCPLKIFISSAAGERIKTMAENYLQQLSMHSEGEEYLLVSLTEHHRCFSMAVPHSGKLAKDEIEFREIANT